ncbi:cobalamin biosynthesis protein [Thalassiella azotivora]
MSARAAGLLVGYALDAALGDPRRWHPVAGLGRAAGALERRVHADDRVRGAVFTAVVVGAAAGAGAAAQRAVRGRFLLEMAVTAAATWTVLGGRSLVREADAVHARLDAGDLPGARRQVARLVGRDTTTLDACGVARAAVESVAENTSDAVVAPLLWGAVAGPAGLLGYRAVNTLDAMVGHRSPRYARFGWASARLDDVANLVPARCAALLAAVLAPGGSGGTRAALAAWRRDARQHPSPNAGPVEASFAGALGVRLGGVNAYAGTVEDRGVLGRGRPVAPGDVPRAARLSRLVGLGAVAVAAGVATAASATPRRPG